MSIKQVFDLVVRILATMEYGEIRLFVKHGRVTHVNRTEEVFPEESTGGGRSGSVV